MNAYSCPSPSCVRMMSALYPLTKSALMSGPLPAPERAMRRIASLPHSASEDEWEEF